MNYYKSFVALFLFMPMICLAACLSSSEESSVNEFIYKGRSIQLPIYDPDIPEKLEFKKYGGNIFSIDQLVFEGYEVWAGGYTKGEHYDEVGVFYFDKKKVVKLIDTNYGYFARYKDDVYVISLNRVNQHSTISSLYKVVKNKDHLEVKKIFELPGIIEWFDYSKEELIAYGGVNGNPFAASIDSEGRWHILKYLPPRDSYE